MCAITRIGFGGDIIACYHPNYTIYYYGQFARFGGKLSQAVLDKPRDPAIQIVPVACGKCCGCRLDRSKDWADRMLLEYATTRDRVKPRTALFLTLTYDDHHLRFVKSTDDGTPLATLCLHDMQVFVKRLRNHYPDRKIRYYYAGEYGDNTYRPHYHMILYGFDLGDYPDCYIYSRDSKLKTDLYESPYLNALWEHGEVKFAIANYETFCYVARYILKKQYGDDKLWYRGRVPPMSYCSKRPALGSDYFDDYDYDRVSVTDGKGVHDIKLPRVVLLKIKDSDPDLYEALMADRRAISAGRDALLKSQLTIPYFDYLHQCETNYYNKRKILGRRGKI